MHADYQISALRELRDQQVRFAPREKKIEQINRAERLLAELNPTQSYSYGYLCQRITGIGEFRPEAYPDLNLSGPEAEHDLRLFVEDLSDSAGVGIDAAGEEVLTIDDLSKRFNVSTKTIARWRQRGLVSRRFTVRGRKRLGFLRSSVERFVARNEDRVRRGTSFSQLSTAEKEGIVAQARRLAQNGERPAEVTRRIARRLGRSEETVRYTLKQFDREHPDLAVFPENSGPLSEETRKKIYQQYTRKVGVEALAKRYRRTRASIYRVINEMRALKTMELPLDYIPSHEFTKSRAEERILTPTPETAESTRKVRLPSGLPPYLASLYEVPLLSREQEQHLFRKFNFLKHRASELRGELDPARAKSSQMDQIERCYEEAVATKNQIIRANLRLVVSIAKRHVGPQANFFELVSDGNISLIRAVEKFDYLRGNKFSTYASWAIMKNFARTIPDELKHRDRFRTSLDEMFTGTEDVRSDQRELEQGQVQLESQVGRMLDKLDEREQRIIISRFGLDRSHEPLTLKEVGEELGVTKERVRQIEARALTKLRRAAAEERVEFLEIE